MSEDVLEKWHREIASANQTVSKWQPDLGVHSDSRCIVDLAARVGELEKARKANMNTQQIIELFTRYGFTDEIGHPLIRCVDFLDLVSQATGEPKEGT